MHATLAAPPPDAGRMNVRPGWTIEVRCPCGVEATYSAVVPSLAGDQAEADGWAVDGLVLAAPGAHEATCPDCTLERTLRSAG